MISADPNVDIAAPLGLDHPATRMASMAHAIDLSTMPPRAVDRRVALAVVLFSAFVFAAAIPFARLKLAPIPAFIPSYEAALAINDLITAVLLFGQFAHLRRRALLMLASAYLFDALMTVPHALTFPGLFADRGLLGAGPQTTAWLYMFWHGGFPLFVIAFVALNGAESDRTASVGRAIAAAILLVGAAATSLTLLATVGQGALPEIMKGNGYTPAMVLVVSSVWAVSLVALALLWRKRRRSVLNLWLMVVMCAWLFDVALSAVLNAGRFDLGFYAGRAYGLLAACFVLGALLLEMNGLHARLARAMGRLEDHAHELKSRVRERTEALARSSETLKAEVQERRQAEEQLRQAQKMEAIGNLTGGMAHDFNNLLAVIIGNLDILRGMIRDNADADELAGEALGAALRGAELTRRLLAFARRQPLKPQRIDVNELVDGLSKLLSRTLGEDVEIVFKRSRALWPVVADAVQLEAALTNLATNSRDAMPKGGRLTITTDNRRLDEDYALQHPEVLPGDYAMIEVSDSGAGMSPEVASHIFEPFFTTKPQGQGTGLGLSMVFGFMKQSGGHINVYSEPGVGTTFRLYLPRVAAMDEPEKHALAEEMPMGQGESVLVVEDNAALRRVVMRQVQELGYRAFAAENAADALALLEKEKIDILFTDLVMPGERSGIELARIVADRWAGTRILLTSGFSGTTAHGDLEALHSSRLLSKPYRRSELARALRALLDG
jgi:signal transduction histidine kinase